MSRQRRPTAVKAAGHSLLTAILVCALLVIPVVFSIAQDAFRFPKELVTRLATILLIVCGAFIIPRRNPDEWLKRSSRVLVFVGLILIWTVIATLMSTNRQLSLYTLLWVTTCSVFFLASHFTSLDRTLRSVEWIVIPTGITIALYALQELEIYHPFQIEKSAAFHGSPAFLGTPDDVAVYLVPASLALLVLWRATERRGGAFYLAIAILAAGTVLWTRTLTAVAGLVIGWLFSLCLMVSRRYRIRTAAATIVAMALCVASIPVLRHRVTETAKWGRAGDYEQMLAGRTLPWAAAWEMIKAHPLIGVGPGCYSWQYFPFRRQAEGDFPRLVSAKLRHSNFGEVHNDVLQLAATTGVGGAVIFLFALYALARFSFRGKHAAASMRREETWARLLAAPLAASMLIIAIGQFPLELAAPTTLVLYLAGSIIGWAAQA